MKIPKYFKITVPIVFAFSFFGLFSPVSAHAATLYFNNAQNDSDWGDLLNWWQDSDFTIQATALPTTTDDVIIDGTINNVSNGIASVHAATSTYIWNNNAYQSITLTVSDGITFLGGSANAGTIDGDVTFNDTSCDYYGGTINGNVTFNNSSTNCSGTINGNAVFNGTFDPAASNAGTITGTSTLLSVIGTTTLTISSSGEAWNGTWGPIVNASNTPMTTWIFSNSSLNNGNISGNAIFYDTSYNSGSVSGSVKYMVASGGVYTVSDGQTWAGGGNSGSIIGSDNQPITTWIFNGGGASSAHVPGNAIFNATSTTYYGSDIGGNAIFNDSSSNGSNGTIEGTALFNDDSSNQGTIVGTSTFSGASGGSITIPDGGQWAGAYDGPILGNDNQPITTWIFNGSSANRGTVAGVAIFNDTSINSYGGIVTSSSTFNNNSSNGYGATVNGDALFNGISSNSGSVGGTATFSAASGGIITIANNGQWDGGSANSVVGSDNQPIIAWVFNGNSQNNATISGNATFNGTSNNLGNVINATFNDQSSDQQGSVSQNATFNTSNYGLGSIGGTTKISNASAGSIIISDGDTWSGSTGSVIGSDNQPITTWTFNGDSNLGGGSTIDGTATFNDTSQSGGTVTGDATFNNSAFNQNNVGGNAYFNGTSYNNGTVTGTAKYAYAVGGIITIPDGSNWGYGSSGGDIGSDNQPITSWVFDGNSANQGTVNGNALFNDGGYNNGTVTGTATFSYASGGVITIPNGSAWGNGSSASNVGNDNSPITSWIFDGNSINYATIPSAIFNDGSSNSGTVTGTAIFNNAVGGVMTVPDRGAWGSGSAGSIVGSDNQPITSWVFNGNSQLNGGATINGNVTFNDISGGDAYTINGNVVLNDGSYVGQYSGISGTSTFNSAVGGILTLPDGSNFWSLRGNPIVGRDGNPITSVVFEGDLSYTQGASNLNSSIRDYKQNATTTLDFTGTGAPWTVIADGVVVNIANATYNNTTVFDSINGGSFSSTTYTVVAPTLTTNAVTSIGTSSATFNGSIISIGNQDVLAGFIYATSSNFSNVIATTTADGVDGYGSFDAPTTFNQSFTNLLPGTTYYVEAYAKNGIHIASQYNYGGAPQYGYGPAVSFTTGGQAPGQSNNSSSTPSTPAPVVYGGGGGGGFASPANLASILAPSPAATAYLNTLKATTAAASVVTASIPVTLSPNTSGTSVTKLQQFLINQGYLTIKTPTGTYGPLTTAAVLLFQIHQGIVSSSTSAGAGNVGPKTLAAINSIIANTVAASAATVPGTTLVTTASIGTFTQDLSIGSTGSEVKALQTYLDTNGYPVSVSGPGSLGNETTTFGPATKAALMKFQAAHNITPVSGYFGPLTRGVINN